MYIHVRMHIYMYAYIYINTITHVHGKKECLLLGPSALCHDWSGCSNADHFSQCVCQLLPSSRSDNSVVKDVHDLRRGLLLSAHATSDLS